MKVMADKCKTNIFEDAIALVRAALFVIIVLLHVPIIMLIPIGRFSVKYMRFFMWTIGKAAGVTVRTHGKLSKARPLLCVANHISVFEFFSAPIGYGCSFVGKIDIASYPLVGWIAKKFGVVFVDRRPSHAAEALEVVSKQMHTASYPVVLFPEGTTTNGAYVKEFKSSLFNIAEEMPDLTIQPLVITYRTKRNKCVNDQVLANDYAYFDNAKQDTGPKCEVERSAFGQIFHVARLGGITVHITALDPVPVKGMDRKEIAKKLHEIVSNKYMELKDKEIKKR
jgi:1-acyl-sn-glycerol-3-phosphate acyltransferase